MFGISYELLLLVGSVALFVGPKELPKMGRIAGRYAGRAVAYVQIARGQFDSIVQQTQANQVHKELRETMAQLEAIRHEIRSVSIMNPGSLSTRLVDNLNKIPTENVENAPEKEIKETKSAATNAELVNSMKDQSVASSSSDVHCQATAFARLAESTEPNSGLENSEMARELMDESGHVIVLPVSAESAELLPKRKGDVKGSDIVLEAILEAEVANNAKKYFSQPQNLKTE